MLSNAMMLHLHINESGKKLIPLHFFKDGRMHTAHITESYESNRQKLSPLVPFLLIHVTGIITQN